MVTKTLQLLSTFGLSENLACYALLLTLGSLGALAHAPFHWVPFLVIAITGLLWALLHAQTKREAFFMGTSFSLGYYTAGLYWIGNAFYTVDLWYLAPIGIFGTPLLIAVIIGTCTIVLYETCHTPLTRALGFTLLWSLWEWALGHWIFGGFSWNLIAYVWDLSLLQATAFVGAYGLSCLTIFCFSLVSTKSKPLIFLALAILGSLWLFGYKRLQSYPETLFHPLNIRLIQPCIEPQGKRTPETMYENLARQIELSQIPGERFLHAIVWPESSISLIIGHQPLFQTLLQDSVPPQGLLIFSAARFDRERDILHSTLFALNTQANIVGAYDKAHLVPFGEYMPLKTFLPFEKLTHGSRDYSPGIGLQTLDIAPLPPFSPLICFEATFPGAVRRNDSLPQWLLNITNDAWYGQSSGPHQHLQNVRVRAIEEGLPLVRGANNGISAVIDPMGRILYRLQTDVVGFIDFQLPLALPFRTFYATYQDWFFWLFVGLVAIWLLILFWRETSSTPNYKASIHIS